MGHGRHRTVRAVLVAAVAAASVAAISATPGVAQDGDEVVFADEAIPAGESTGVSGECGAEDAVEAEVRLQSVPFGDTVVMRFQLDEAGTFDATFHVPPDIAARIYDVVFWCSNGMVVVDEFIVDDAQVVGTFEVLPYEGEPPVGLVFSPSAVAPGGELAVSGRCTMGDVAFSEVGVHVNDWFPADQDWWPPDAPPAQFGVGLPVAADGSFEGALTVPGGWPAGMHSGYQFCSSENAYYLAWSGSVEILASDTPPPPVPTTPRFTG